MSDVGNLRFGSFELIDSVASSWTCAALAEGTDWGNPQPITVAIASLLRNGSTVATQGYDTREISIRVIFTAADLAALAEGTEALFAETGKPNTLTWTPPNGYAAPTVFEVDTSYQNSLMDDLGEVRNPPERQVSLTLICRPFGRSEFQTDFAPTAATIGTARQRSYTIAAGGSAPSEPSLHVAGSGSLGNVLLYTRPGAPGMLPLRQYRTAGTTGTTAAAGNVSGRYDNDIATPFVAEIPAEDLPIADRESFIVLCRAATAASEGDALVDVIVETVIDGDVVATTGIIETSVGLTTTYGVRQIALPFQLGLVPAAAIPNALVRVTISDVTVGLTVRLDEAWIAAMTTGALTWVQSVSKAHLWTEPPTTERDYRQVLVGASFDQTDASFAAMKSWGNHVLEPGDNSAFLVTDDDTTTVDAFRGSHFRHWHSHAVD